MGTSGLVEYIPIELNAEVVAYIGRLEREKAALHYADLFKQGEHAIDKDEVYTELAKHFSDEEIIELGLFCAEVVLAQVNLDTAIAILHVRERSLTHHADGREPPSGEPNRCPLGDGTIPLRAIVRALLTAGYSGYFEVELMGEEIEAADYRDVLARSVATFRDWTT